jgi:hypothetical protein
VEEILGFQEGPLPDDWVRKLKERPSPLPSIAVHRDLLREEARATLAQYRESDGPVYNAGSESA